MHRNQFRKLLRRYQPTHEEKAFKEKMKAFVDVFEDCFERSLDCGHFTASAMLLNKNRSKALLLHHAKLNIWVQPGGHADGDSNLLLVAIKEAQEESGILGIIPVSEEIFDIDIHQIPANAQHQAHDHFDVRFLLQVNSDEEFIKNEESKELLWVDQSTVKNFTKERSVLRLFEKVAKFLEPI